MIHSSDLIPTHFFEWEELLEKLPVIYPEDFQCISSDLNLFKEKINKQMNNYDEFFIEKVSFDLLGCFYNSCNYQLIEKDWNDIYEFYKASSLTKINIDYKKLKKLKFIFNPIFFSFQTQEFCSAQWFIKEFSRDLLLSSELFRVLCSGCNQNEIQDTLFNLLGAEKIELISEIIKLSSSIVEQFFEIAECRKAYLADASRCEFNSLLCPIRISNTVLQNQQKSEEKKRKKRVEKFQKELSFLDWNYLDQFFSETQLINLVNKSRFQQDHPLKRNPIYPFVFDTQVLVNESFVLSGKTLQLPVNTRHIKEHTYEEFIIPPPSQEAPIDWVQIKLTNTDDLTRGVFKELDTFNPIQSLIFDKALNSCENLLVCAPTGAGKTNIALLTILRELRLHFLDDQLTKNHIKVVYVAPMKALATEITVKLDKALSYLGLLVKEITGDIQPTRGEILKCHVIVTTPEKWDVMTRKADSETSYTLLTRLLILDEIHLLQDDRGAVLEAIVSRSLRFVESRQLNLRILGLSATLPNYLDVCSFLRVNPSSGLFFFDNRFRPVPLEQSLIGIKTTTSPFETFRQMDNVCFEETIDFLKNGHQVIIFVHSRESTRKTAQNFLNYIQNKDLSYLLGDVSNDFHVKDKISSCRVHALKELLLSNTAIHHAGLSRHDRSIVENLFLKGFLRVLVSTSTLAWGVNLPARAVIIRGTSIYDASKGRFRDLGILDIQQMFGRAGRPQYDTKGCGVLITEHRLLPAYIKLLLQQYPIESKLLDCLADSLNAEISLGTVVTVDEAISWLSYTFFFVRMLKNPLAYGISWKELESDPQLVKHRRTLICACAEILDKSRMIRYNPSSGSLLATAFGRIGSHFYIKCKSINVFNENLHDNMTVLDILKIVSNSSEFEFLKLRDEEHSELVSLNQLVPYKYRETEFSSTVKVLTLLQANLSRIFINTPSLASDLTYIVQNIGRILRGLFEICISRGFPQAAHCILTLCKCFDFQIWPHEHPLFQLRPYFQLNKSLFDKILNLKFSIERLREMDSNEIGQVLHHHSIGPIVKEMILCFPSLDIQVETRPLTQSVIQLRVLFKPTFKWHNPMMAQGGDIWVYWVEDPETHIMYHYNRILINSKRISSREPIIETFTIPVYEPLAAQLVVRVVSNRFIGAETHAFIDTDGMVLPKDCNTFTKLLSLQPLPVTALGDHNFQSLFNFSYFNPIQTQLFHTLYHTDCNVLLGAPTGSGKTVIAELAFLRVFRQSPLKKVVYIAPMKALVRERFIDWSKRISSLGKNLVELTGDVVPDSHTLLKSDVILSTPEKWDGVSRGWRDRSHVREVALIILDEVHLLGSDRGHSLEAIVARVNIIGFETGIRSRIVALSTAVSNPLDLAAWLSVPSNGLFNFDPSVRPVPLVAHIHGFPAKNYCPRMESMNKTVYQAIKNYSLGKPVLIFVSSRRQTRQTASSLLTLSSSDGSASSGFKTSPDSSDTNEVSDASNEVLKACDLFSDENLKIFIPFGIAIHHAGLCENDRLIVERLFLTNKIQVLVSTATLAWGVNFPAHLVIVKGTEYYDAKSHTYIDFPVTDILQMMGRAGRPQFDTSGVAVVLVHEPKKDFYKKFLYEPFPVESAFLAALPDHLNAEITSGTLQNFEQACSYLHLTFWHKRLLKNPSYYNSCSDPKLLEIFKRSTVQTTLLTLVHSDCIIVNNDELEPTSLGSIASHYYLSHKTVKILSDSLATTLSMYHLLNLLSNVTEFDNVPVRHNEENYNEALAGNLPLKPQNIDYTSPHVKTFLLLQAHIARAPLPIKDYFTDTKTVLDQASRVLEAMIDIASCKSKLSSTLQCILLLQSIVQAVWWNESSLLTIPGFTDSLLNIFNNQILNTQITSVAQLLVLSKSSLSTLKPLVFDQIGKANGLRILRFIEGLPNVTIVWTLLTDDNVVLAKSSDLQLSENNTHYIKCPCEVELKILVSLKAQFLSLPSSNKICSSSMGKDIEESWTLVVGERCRDELIMIKRTSAIRYTFKTSINIGSWAKEDIGSCRLLTLYLMSKCLMGLDQQIDIPLELIT